MTDDELIAMMDGVQPPPSFGGGGKPAGIPPLGEPIPQAPEEPPAPAAPPLPNLPPPQIPQAAPAPVAQVAPPPSGLPPPTATGPAVPTKSVTDRETTSVTSRTKISDEERNAQAKLDADEKAAETNTQAAGKLAGQVAEQTADVATQKRDLLKQHGTALSDLVRNADNEYKRADDRYQAAFEAARAAKPSSFWADDKTGSKKFWAGVAIALSGLSERDNGGHNTSYDMITAAVDRHDKAEQARIGRMRDDADHLRGERDVVLTKKHEKLADLAAWKSAAYDMAAAELEARLGALGKSKAEIDANADILKLRAKRDEEKAQFAQATRTEIKNQVVTKTQSIVGGAGAAGAVDKPIQQWKPEERKAEGFAMRGWKASEEMDRFKYNPADMQVLTNAARREAMAGGITGMADKAWKLLNVSTYNQLSPEGKKRYNATREFIISGLRPESGAAISLGELADAEQRYGTVPGDNKTTAPQKKQNRMAKLAEIGIQSGRPQFWINTTGAYGPQGGGQAAPQAPAQQPQKPGLPPGAIPGTFHGQRGYALNGKFYPLEVAQQ